MTVVPLAPPRPQKVDMDMEPWRRSVQLPLPTLEYESDLKVWQWRVKLVLEHLSLWKFVPIASAPRRPYGDPEKEAAQAAYCTALLASCISETILADILTILLIQSPRKETTLSRERELPDEPYVLFEYAVQMVKAVQMIRKDGSNTLQDFLSGAQRPTKVEHVLGELDALPRKGDTLSSWLHIILIAVLLIKIYNLADLTGIAVQDIIERAHNLEDHLVESDFNKLKNELLVAQARGQK